jgi:hypothetical protein
LKTPGQPALPFCWRAELRNDCALRTSPIAPLFPIFHWRCEVVFDTISRMPKPKHKKPASPPRISGTLRSLLTALQGAPFTGVITQPQILLSSLTSIRGFLGAKPKAGLAMPITATIWSCCREIQGIDCEKKAQIVATYFNSLAPGDKPIGEADVTALLNLAASQRCADELKCPSKCPASFTEQKKLFEYHFFAGVGGKNAYESGILTIPKSEWNCRCQEPVQN